MSIPKKVESAIESLRQEFIDNPGDFNVEKSFQTALKIKLLNSISPQRAKVDKKNIDSVRQPQVKETLKNIESIPRVREEAQFLDGDVKGAIDLVVLDSETEFHMKPAKKYLKKDVRAAIGLKFLKTAASIYAPKEEEIRSQINRLNKFGLSSHKYFVVFAVKDVFRDQQNLLKDFREELDGMFYYQCTPT